MYSEKLGLFCLTKNTHYSDNDTTVLERSFIPLRTCNHDITVDNYLVEHKINLEFINDSEENIEATFICPLHYDTCIYDFRAVIGSTVICCKLKEKEEAHKEYTKALEEGKKTVLMDKEGSDLFSCKVGNIAPHQKALITISSCYELAQEATYNSFRLTIPISITPRFSPQGPYESNKNSLGNSFSTNPQYTSKPYDITVDGKIKMNCEEISVNSLQGSIKLSDLNKNSLSFGCDSIECGNDVVLLIQRSTGYSFLISEHQETSTVPEYNYAHLLNIVPTQESMVVIPAEKSDYVIVADKSGSMQGPRLAQMKNALKIVIQTLVDGCGMSIFTFNDSFNKFSHESNVLTPEYRTAAQNWIDTIMAGGGTQFVPVLQQAITDLSCNEKANKNIIFLTDGDVGNTNSVLSVIELAKKLGIRIFILGIGDGCSKELLVKIARITRGHCDFVKDNEDMLMKMIAQITKTRTAVSELSLNIDTNGTHKIVGFKDTDYIYGDCNNMFYLHSTDPINRITFGNQEIHPEFINNGLMKMVGKRIIDNTKDKNIKIEASLNTGVLCEHTSFIGVEEVEETVEDVEKNVKTVRKILVPLHNVGKNYEHKGYDNDYDDENEECCMMMSSSSFGHPKSMSRPKSMKVMKESIREECRMIPESMSRPKGMKVMNESMRSGGYQTSMNARACFSIESCSAPVSYGMNTNVGTKRASSEVLKNMPIIDELILPNGNDIVTPMSMRSPRDSEEKSSPRGPFETLKQKLTSFLPSFINSQSSPRNSISTKGEIGLSGETGSQGSSGGSTANTCIKCTLEDLDEFDEVGDCYISRKLIRLCKENVIPGDFIQVTRGKYQGIYKVIHAGSDHEKWVIKKSN